MHYVKAAITNANYRIRKQPAELSTSAYVFLSLSLHPVYRGYNFHLVKKLEAYKSRVVEMDSDGLAIF